MSLAAIVVRILGSRCAVSRCPCASNAGSCGGTVVPAGVDQSTLSNLSLASVHRLLFAVFGAGGAPASTFALAFGVANASTGMSLPS